jgi:hypothetical protein
LNRVRDYPSRDADRPFEPVDGQTVRPHARISALREGDDRPVPLWQELRHEVAAWTEAG